MSYVTYTNQSCPTYKIRCVPHMTESCHTDWVMFHIWKSQVPRMNEYYCCVSMIHGTHLKILKAYIWMSHDTHLDESFFTYGWVKTHIWMSHSTQPNLSWHTYAGGAEYHVTHLNESWHTSEWVMAHIWMSHETHIWMSHRTQPHKLRHIYAGGTECHGTHLKESWHTYAGGAVCNDTHLNESWHTYEWVIAHISRSNVARLNVSFRTRDELSIQYMNEPHYTCQWVMSHT